MHASALSTRVLMMAAALSPLSCTFQARDPNGDPAAPGATTANGGENASTAAGPGDGPPAAAGAAPVIHAGGTGPAQPNQSAPVTSDCGPSNYPAVALSPGFMPDPLGTQGTSGGEINATALGNSQTGPCTGWYASRPDHTMHLAQAFQYLRVNATSTDDTTLIIRGPDGLWCSDDEGGGHDPRIHGAWVAGCYQIWVGSYQQGAFSPYQISFSERR